MLDVQLFPMDELNEELIHNTHPTDWVNPKPDGRYNLVVIGGGSAGLVAAAGAAGIGAKVALIEKNLLGGDCLNVGCVPSKTVIRSGHAAHAIRSAAEFGIHVPEGMTVDFAKVMERMRKVRTTISPHDSAYRFTKEGIDVFLGVASFTGPNTLEIDGQTIEFSKAMIATGSRPAHIPIPGLDEVGYLNNEQFFYNNLSQLPERIAVIGGGPIGSELAQALQRLGAQVTIIDVADQILGREDKEAAAIVQNQLIEDGVRLLLSAKTSQVASRDGQKVLHYEQDGVEGELVVDEILLAVGRKPNVEGLNLEAAGVTYNKRGVDVNDQLQTSNPNIYAGGDVALKYQFTHVAGHAAAIIIQNALFPFPKRKFSDLIIPWVTYTSPEVAHVGMYPHEAAEQGIEIDTFTAQMDRNDRALAEGDTDGFVKIHVKKGSDKILGATIVAETAGEMLNEITLAMKHNIGLGAINNVIHPYPTQAEAITKAANEYNKTRLTPFVKRLFSWWLARTR